MYYIMIVVLKENNVSFINYQLSFDVSEINNENEKVIQ